MEDMKPTRFTIPNEDTIVISRSLLMKLTAANEPKEASKTAPSAPIPSPPQPPPQLQVCQALNISKPVPALPLPPTSANASFREDDISKYADPFDGVQGGDLNYTDSILTLRDAYENKLKLYRQEWQSRYKQLESLNERLLKESSAKLAAEANGVEAKHFSGRAAYSESPCQLAETAVKQCYLENGKKPLLCASLVKAFDNCVRQAQLDLFKSG